MKMSILGLLKKMDKRVISYRRPSRYEPGKTVNIIFGEPTSVQSLASLVLLTDYFRHLEVKSWCEKLDVKLSKIDYGKCSNYELLKILRNIFNRRFLESKSLICEYCKKPMVLSEEGKKQRHDTATVDHRIPLLEDCDWFDETNLVACCHDCNNSKGDISHSDWIEKLTLLSQKKSKIIK